MDITLILVAIGVVSLIGIALWYIFSARNQTSAVTNHSGMQEFDVTVKGGYTPDVISVILGVPVRLNFFRDESDSRSERVDFADFGISRKLPAFTTTVIDFTPDRAGVFPFICGMGMLHGKLIVESPK